VDELAVFQDEIAALEAAAAVEQGAADGPGVADGPPTPDELEFEDDDGTVYVWDKRLRKYMPKVCLGGQGVATTTCLNKPVVPLIFAAGSSCTCLVVAATDC
jgi:hypothetical protein